MMHQKTKIIAGVSGVICITAAVLFFGALYTLSLKKEALTTLVAQVAATKARENELASLVRLVEGTREERAELGTRILSEEGVIDFLSLIETVAEEQGVALVTDALAVSDVSPAFETLNVNLSLTGSYEGVVHVLEMLETLPYQASVTHATLTADELGEWSADIALSVTKMKKI